MNRYVLPDLAYDYSALEPEISGEILELHHSKHHAAYVTGANEALEKIASAKDPGSVAGLERSLAFNVSGHILHSIFWKNLAPDGEREPTGDLKTAIDEDLGGFETFKKRMIDAATSTMGSGWAALVFEPAAQRLMVGQIHDHQSQHPQGAIPILVLDAWEHAYYLQYRTEKAKYFEAIWKKFDFEDVAFRFDAARALDLDLEFEKRARAKAVDQPELH